MSALQQKLIVTSDTTLLPHRPQLQAREMLVPHLANQPFRGTQTTDEGMPQGVDTRTVGFHSDRKE